MKLSSHALAMLIRAYSAVLKNARLSTLMAATVLTAAVAVPAQAETLTFNGTQSVQDYINRADVIAHNSAEETEGTNEISQKEPNGVINLSGTIDFTKIKWKVPGSCTGDDESKYNFTGFMANSIDANSGYAEANPINREGGVINIAAGSKLIGTNYNFMVNEDGGKGRSQLRGVAVFDDGDIGGYSATLKNSKIDVKENVEIDNMEITGTLLSIGETEKPITGSVNGSISFADSTSGSLIKHSAIVGAVVAQNDPTDVKYDIDSVGSVYIGKNVAYQGTNGGHFDYTLDDVDYDTIIGAINTAGGSATGTITINGSVTDAVNNNLKLIHFLLFSPSEN